ncbi:molybdopterin-dependent oxidoreductase [Thauera sp. CAU 1555]|uniref:Molybdopterin-dependent oxidoreductase n=2 Tax=Thauera sedimentorum TaxID=2767595 RepID=A0ABR9B7I0_9RHOO|nr:molybdopterin-dependent oxidoreductase [Thauera sedimentorum]MBD8501425.1 molybdopterin-dependent oxidoreductase [Thauera sedimentorum]
MESNMNLADIGPASGQEVRTACCYCGTGCGVIAEHDGRRITGVRGDPAHPANFGRLCTKGSALHQAAAPGGRALFPELRSARGLPRRRVGWDSALDGAAERFAAIIREHGPDAVAFYISGQLLTEDYYVFNKLARALVGTHNIDSNSRLCMSSAVAGYKGTLGADSVPACYEDIDHASHLLIAGANPAWAHPIVFRRIEAAKRANPGLSITVVDPRRTETAEFADLHLQIAPGSDVLLYNAMLHVLLWEDLVDRDFIRDHTSGFDALRAQLAECSPGAVATACGVPAERIVEAARRFGNARAALSLWCMGLNQSHHGTASNSALIHLHLATGQIGRPGAGPFSLTGQPNAMGGREVGAMATILPGHRDPANAAECAELAALWGVPALPATPGLTAVQLFDALAEGKVKAVWIACTNPAHSLPDQTRVRAALEKAEFVVLQEAFADTETAPYADLLLPAASWGEKSGTVTNSERRVSRVRAAVPAPGEARADWTIAADFARRLAQRMGRSADGFAWADEAAVFAEHVTLSAGRDCDMSGLSHALLDARGPQQWPFPQGAEQGSARLFTDHRFPTADGRARFNPAGFPQRHALLPEPVDARHPFVLLTGRLRDHWHGMSRTGKVAGLWGHTPRAEVALNPADISRRGLRAGQLVRVAGRRGAVVLPLAADAALAPGQAWIPMHWGAATLAQPGANTLTSPATDPISRQPALKQAAVAIAPAELPWRAAWAVATDSAADAVARMAALQPWLARFAYAAQSLVGRTRRVLVLQVADVAAPDEALLHAIDAVFECTAQQAPLAYRDARRGIAKWARVDQGRLAAIRLVGESAAADWLVAAIAAGDPADSLRSWLFAPLAEAPQGLATASRVVCNCHGVSETQIREAVAGGADLALLQTTLKCGTACGSCLPELRRLAAGAVPSATGSPA